MQRVQDESTNDKKLVAATEQRRREAERHVTDLRLQTQQIAASAEKKLAELEDAHSRQMESADKTVRMLLQKKDAEINELREQVRLSELRAQKSNSQCRQLLAAVSNGLS